MPDSFTANLHLTLPEVGSSSDTWGSKLNGDLTTLDSFFSPSHGAGVIVREDASGNAQTIGIGITSNPGVGALIVYKSAASGNPNRWFMGAEGDTDTGGNVGSTFAIGRYNDAGVFIANSIQIDRPTGVVKFETTPTVVGNQVYHQGNLPAVTAPLAEPVGTVKMYCGTSDPAGGFFMLCDGRTISRTTYAALFGIIGTQYGAGDGSTTFAIPNTAERVIVGHSTVQSRIPQFDCRAMGNSFGEGQHVIAAGELPQHAHPITDVQHSHIMGVNENAQGGSSFTGTQAGAAGTSTQPAFTGITTTQNSAAPTGQTNIVQPSIVMNFIIRVQ